MRLLLFILVVIALVLLVWFTGTLRTLKSIWLIVEVRPYEQIGVGENPPSILVLGDSTGYGTGAGHGKYSIAGLIGADYSDYTIINNSKNGRTIGEALAEIKTLPTAPKHKLILLQIGGNDILAKRPIDVVRGELGTLHQEVKSRAEHVVMISSGNVGTSAAFTGTKKADEYDRLSRQYRELFIAMARESDVTYVDLFEETDQDAFLREPKKYLAIDGLHPSREGYAYWYKTLRPEIAVILNE